jgi:glycosyltransferase involved in cell wall biosynthesis
MKISFVIPALNEEQGIGKVIEQIPVSDLKNSGYEVEIIVSDNGSTDKTAEIARQHGAVVVPQPIRGYGNAYKAGFAKATGEIIITGDADMTYPFNESLDLLKIFKSKDLEFMTTDRLTSLNSKAMTYSHIFGNWLLSLTMRILFNWPYKDSQSGMWIFKKEILKNLDVRSGGMPFSQELKLEAYFKGYKYDEVPISYHTRIGQVKLNTIKDGVRNTLQLLKKRFTIKRVRQYE